MRYVAGFVVGILIAAAISAQLGGTRSARTVAPFATVMAVSDWMSSYYQHPEPNRLPDAVAALYAAGALREPPKVMAMSAFFAGVIENDADALPLLARAMANAPAEQQSFIALAVSLSGREEWRQELSNLQDKLPGARKKIEELLAAPTSMHPLQIPLDRSAAVLDMQWAYFMATGKAEPVLRLVSALPGMLEETDIRRIGNGYAAKWSLASNAWQHPKVMEICRREAAARSEPVAGILRDVIAAADARDAGRIRREGEAALRAWQERQQQKKG
jgi:hypothetical protein